MKSRRSLSIIFLLFIFCNFIVVNAETKANYYSTKLKEGKVLKWEESICFISPERINITNFVEITIIQDIPDFVIDHDFLYRYFNATINGTIIEENRYSLPHYALNSLIRSYIYPIRYVYGLSTLSLYEHYLNISGDYQNFTLEQNEGNLEVNGTLTDGDDYIRFENVIHEKTGILRYRNNLYMLNEINFIIEIVYLGGMNLVSSDFTIVTIVLLGIPFVGTIFRRKIKKIQPPLG